MKANLAAALLLAALPAAARSRAPKNIPTADEALAHITSFPSEPCLAHGRIQFFREGKKPKGIGTTVYTSPDGFLRRDIFEKGPRKPAAMTIVDDGRQQRLLIPKLDREWDGVVAREPGGDALARLKSIYEISVSTGGHVAKMTTWRIDFRAPGGPLRRSFWVDRKSGLLLKTEEYRYDGALARRERIVKLEMPAESTQLGLVIAMPSDQNRGPQPLIPADPPVQGTSTHFPRWMPLGFLPLEARAESGGARISYGDGAAQYTVLEAPAGTDSGLDEKAGREIHLKDGSAARLLPAGDGAGLVLRTPTRTLVIAGDLADEELVRVAESVEAAR
jgi:hypothetical protein